ncbi:cupin domain-containing protein [Nonomuraea sp. NPDC050643]|uniref:cupin domain-containing protein n=1 Tax=Nonomuraea sp. NPDC050643 TaxID=3155660 RepID=UPI0034038E71
MPVQPSDAAGGDFVRTRSGVLVPAGAHVAASTTSGNHHHGASETAIYVVSGHPAFVFLDVEGDEPVEVRVQTSPGDYIFVPPFVPHREENPDPETEAVVVIARTTQEAIVVNLDGLDWTEVEVR